MVANSIILTIFSYIVLIALIGVGSFVGFIGCIMMHEKNGFDKTFPWIAGGIVCWAIAIALDLFVI